MKKKVLATVIVGGMCLGFLELVPAIASSGNSSETIENHKEKVTVSSNTEEDSTPAKESLADLRKLKDRKNYNELVNQYGVTTEGKKTEDVVEELHQATLIDKAKELGISTEGKSMEVLEKEINKALLNKKALDLGISPEGKSDDALLMEIEEKSDSSDTKKNINIRPGKEKRVSHDLNEKEIIEKAKSIGIDIENKSFDEILNDISQMIIDSKEE